MFEEIAFLAGAASLSTSAGLNAYLPLLLVGLAARYTGLVRLNEPFSVLTEGWVLAILAVLLLFEIIVDKIPVADTINDLFQTAGRPLAGAILFAGASGPSGQAHPLVALLAGLLIAGGVHAAKMTVRPVVTAVTGGMGNWFVSLLEDTVSFLLAILAILVPLVAFGAIVVIVAACVARMDDRRADG